MDHPALETRSHGRSGTERTLRGIAIAAAFVLLLWLLSNVVLVIVMAALMAVMLRGMARAVARHTGAPEGAMLALITVLSVVLMGAFLYYLGPQLAAQCEQLWSQLGERLGDLRRLYGQSTLGHLVFSEMPASPDVKAKLGGYAALLATSTVTSMVTAFILVVTSLYFAISPGLYVEGIVRLFPLPRRGRAREVIGEVGRTLRWWSVGQIADMVTVGVLTGVGLAILGVPLAFALAVLSGLLTFVPYFGAVVAAVPAMMVALTMSWQTALWVLLVFLVSHAVESYLVSPFVQRRTANLPPAVSILAMTVLGTVFGPLGVILGTPIAAALLVIVREAYVRDVLGDEDVGRSA